MIMVQTLAFRPIKVFTYSTVDHSTYRARTLHLRLVNTLYYRNTGAQRALTNDIGL